MEKIILGEPFEKKDGFRETCFGIVIKDNKVLVFYDKKYNQYTLIGGGIDNNDSHVDTLKREFLEEIGATIKNIKPFITIDCFWLAGLNKDYKMESLAHFYIVEVDEFLNIEHESNYEYIDINKLDLPLPYQKEAINLLQNKKKF